MKPSLLFGRESGNIIRTAGRMDWIWRALAAAALPALAWVFFSAMAADTRDRNARAVALVQGELERAFDAGVRQGHADMVASATEAWRAAQAEAEHARLAAAPCAMTTARQGQ